jgi:putative resolvase
MNYVSSKEASRVLGLHPNTLRNYADNGTIKSAQSKSGHWRYNVESYLGLEKQTNTICYCRVSSPKQRDDLARQVEFMRARYPEAEIVKDIVRSLNYKRKGLKAILGRAMRTDKLEIVVAHKDRLARFGFEF